MADEQKSYKKHKLVVRLPEGGFVGRGTDAGEAHGLFVDDQFAPTERHEATGRFWTRELPYQDYESLIELGQALIDRKLR